MKYALNKSKTLVDAATAPKDERPFKCPSCKKPVVLRQGMWNAPCFSHWPGEGSIACELFTAAASQRWGHRLNYHERRKSGINTGFVRLCVKGDSIFDYSLLIAI